ncbi:MAG TPA: serine hydrolase domain-containing protein [Blastocatellia bacterium]|nr:serine hydrolase domain-containing protein [Blastocatellia bacterium]
MAQITRIMVLFVIVLLTGAAAGQGIRSVAPNGTGLSTERLDRIGAVMKDHVDKGHIAGAIGLIARRGKVGYFETYGFQDKEAGVAMRKDTIFRMYSMTKPITGVAVMILYEEGKFALSEPVSKYLPELGNMKVAVVETDPRTGKKTRYSVPAQREISILDLLRHTSGIDYGGPEDVDGKRIYEKLGTNNLDQTIGEMVKKIGQAPLVHQPGTMWEYGLSMDVLARLVEVVSGQPYDKFLEQRIFKPLKMDDTGYWVPADKKNRFAKLYAPGEGWTIKPNATPAQTSYLKPAVNFGGGSQTVSTASDYLRFCQMLLNGGELEGVRILSRKTVELMTSDHLGDMPRGGVLGRGYGFGFTMAVSPGPGKTGVVGSEGEYYWGGAAGTRFWIDPKEQMIGIFMIQILPHTNLTYGTQFRQLAYQAIVD